MGPCHKAERNTQRFHRTVRLTGIFSDYYGYFLRHRRVDTFRSGKRQKLIAGIDNPGEDYQPA
ncbi:hypothetical protein NITLEN_20180 [Nitrospira lenta]|uniref:Uncharacterized protein n=1 Tax=Nitrospira lenta TaxID=1436998 RepID=A0A330L5E2_9BACT|nr:hypothetical protein NITLEN_20180 [Nitrospira lenta]